MSRTGSVPSRRTGAAERTAGSTGRACRQPAVELRGITKRFPGVVANHDIDITVRQRHRARPRRRERRRQVDPDEDPLRHAAAGRGHHRGRRRAGRASLSPADAIARGIGMVHQHFMLADNLTVLENVVLGSERSCTASAAARPAPDQGDLRRVRARTSSPTRWSRTSASATGSAWRSSRSSTAAPASSSSTSPPRCSCRRRSTRSSTNLRELKAEGLTVIFISHKLDEVLVGRRRDHRHPARHHRRHAPTRATTTARQLAELMVGSELPSPETRESTVTDRADARASTGLTVATTPDGRRACSTTSRFTIHKGEVLGIAGVEGNGQAELVEAHHGHAARRPRAGRCSTATTSPHWPTRKRREAASATSPRTGTGTACCWRPRCGRTASSATSPSRPTPRASWLDRAGARARHRADRRGVRRPHPRHRGHRGRAVRRQPAEADRRPRDEPRPEAAASPPTPPAAWTSARRPRSGTRSARPAARAWPCC